MNFAVERTAVGEDRRKPTQKLIALVRRQLVLLSALLCAIVLSNIATNAQLTTADIIGTVYDSSGAVLPKAKVTLMNQGTHETRNAQSGNGGEYSFAFLLPGSYSVRVEAQGFTTFTSTVEISAGDREGGCAIKGRANFRECRGGFAEPFAANGKLHGREHRARAARGESAAHHPQLNDLGDS